jgi:hypothetical protein
MLPNMQLLLQIKSIKFLLVSILVVFKKIIPSCIIDRKNKPKNAIEKEKAFVNEIKESDRERNVL